MRYLGIVQLIYVLLYFAFTYVFKLKFPRPELGVVFLLAGIVLINLIDNSLVVYLFLKSKLKKYKVDKKSRSVSNFFGRTIIILALLALILGPLIFSISVVEDSYLYAVFTAWAITMVVSQFFLGYLLGGYVLADASKVYIYPSGPMYPLKKGLSFVALDGDKIGVKGQSQKWSEGLQPHGFTLSGAEKDRFLEEQKEFIAKAE